MPWELVVVVVAGMVGVVDAVVGGQIDLAVVFAVVVLFGLLSFLRVWTNRRRVVLRADLAAWLSRRAVDRGTSLDDEAGHAIAAFRSGVTPDTGSSEPGQSDQDQSDQGQSDQGQCDQDRPDRGART
jgi:hypothetical protein